MGFDADTERIAVAVAEPGPEGEVRDLGTIPNREESVRRLVKKPGPASRVRVCYEAGPLGCGPYWRLSGLGVHGDVVAPTLVPVESGDRANTNGKDARKLARSYRSGARRRCGCPDAEHEALRDLVRAREAAKNDQLRARHRLGRSSAPRASSAQIKKRQRGLSEEVKEINVGAEQAPVEGTDGKEDPRPALALFQDPPEGENDDSSGE